jgi:hypothetical protein
MTVLLVAEPGLAAGWRPRAASVTRTTGSLFHDVKLSLRGRGGRIGSRGSCAALDRSE